MVGVARWTEWQRREAREDNVRRSHSTSRGRGKETELQGRGETQNLPRLGRVSSDSAFDNSGWRIAEAGRASALQKETTRTAGYLSGIAPYNLGRSGQAGAPEGRSHNGRQRATGRQGANVARKNLCFRGVCGVMRGEPRGIQFGATWAGVCVAPVEFTRLRRKARGTAAMPTTSILATPDLCSSPRAWSC